MQLIQCPFRHSIETQQDTEVAVCGYLERITLLPSERCVVDRSACEVCLGRVLPPGQFNPALPSLVLSACGDALSGPIDDSVPRYLANWAWSAIDSHYLRVNVPWIAAAEIIIESPSVEMIGQQLEELRLRFGWLSGLLFVDDQTDEGISDGQATGVRLKKVENRHRLLENIKSSYQELTKPWLLLSGCWNKELPSIAWREINRLEASGAELSCGQFHGERNLPADDSKSSEIDYLVIRRTTLIDILEREFDEIPNWRDLVSHADRTGRVLLSSAEEEANDQPRELTPEQAPWCNRTPRRRWMNRNRSGSECDVVLPFRDHLDYVSESLEALLAQEDAAPTIHLVDDASVGATDQFLDQYRRHERIRIYRNSRNLGPFATFNNIALLSEARYLAVQDADDISLSHRIAISTHLLECSGADLFAGRTEVFGDTSVKDAISDVFVVEADGSRKSYRSSRDPSRSAIGYFLENPTLVVRRNSFLQLGGYADFGDRSRSRTGVDTELQLRAHYSRSHLMVSREVLVRYRSHPASATNHPSTGLQSTAFQESRKEVFRRLERYVSGSFDPRWFGALHLFEGLTRRI